MQSLIFICLSVIIIGIIVGIIIILLNHKCTPGDPLCDDNNVITNHNNYNNKWLNDNSYIIEYPNDTSKYFMLRGKTDFNKHIETSIYQPVIDSIDNCANYLTHQTNDNNYFIKSHGNNNNNLTCNIKKIDNSIDDKITIISGTNSNDTYFYKGLIDNALLRDDGDTCMNRYNNCILSVNTGLCNKYMTCKADITTDNTLTKICKRYACEFTSNPNECSLPNVPCSFIPKITKHTKDPVDCAFRMKEYNKDMATYDKKPPKGMPNCYYRNFPSSSPYNYLIFRK